MTSSPRCLVIDIDIARSAGGMEAQEGRSKSCRDFLIAVLETEHKVVTTEAIRTEWHKHQSRFTRTWLVSMVARKKVCWIDAPADEEMRKKVEQVADDEQKRNAMLKDIHLIEAALQVDQIVISMDETVRHYFRKTALTIGIIRQIVWVNPCKDEETPLEWLRTGAALEKRRSLGQS
ncbi:MAG: hypothetical protein M3Y39_09620 [Chloroflexota bacterium]|nr:hypothetical protein [Chloroflexota bacterium]